MLATAIIMKKGRECSNNPLDIDKICIEDKAAKRFYTLEELYDWLDQDSSAIVEIDIEPYQRLIPAMSSRREKYVRAVPIVDLRDRLMMLPRG